MSPLECSARGSLCASFTHRGKLETTPLTPSISKPLFLSVSFSFITPFSTLPTSPRAPVSAGIRRLNNAQRISQDEAPRREKCSIHIEPIQTVYDWKPLTRSLKSEVGDLKLSFLLYLMSFWSFSRSTNRNKKCHTRGD